MRWSFSTIVLVPRGRSFARPLAADRRRVFSWAKSAGFEGVELADEWLDLPRLDDRALREIHTEIADAGLCVSGLNIPRCLSPRESRTTLQSDRLERAVAAADLLAADLVNFSLSVPRSASHSSVDGLMGGCDASVREHHDAAERLRRLAGQAQSAGISLAIELHDDGLLDTPELCLQFLACVDRPNVGVNPDIANLCRGPGPLPDWRRAFELLAPHACNWHVKNYRQSQPVTLTEGDIDFTVAWKIMRASNYAGWVSIESRLGDALAEQCAALDFLRSLFSSTFERASG